MTYKSYKHDKPLLERLREHHNLNTPQANAMQEAADEIERLQEMLNCIADYVEQEICLVTAEMIRRMINEKWRYKPADKKESKNGNT